jgi:hypothetical protein
MQPNEKPNKFDPIIDALETVNHTLKQLNARQAETNRRLIYLNRTFTMFLFLHGMDLEQQFEKALHFEKFLESRD